MADHISSEIVTLSTAPTWKEKFASRKFLFSLAAFLMALGTGITGLAQGDAQLAMAGGFCCVVSSAIYSACEAWVDANRELANGTSTYITDESKEA